MTAERPMCEAVAAATLLPGRNPRRCASHASKVVGHGMPHHVCGMHFDAWERACGLDPGSDWKARTRALAARWGWPDEDAAAKLMESLDRT